MYSIFSEFKRKFSMCVHKNMKIMLGEMSFSKDFITSANGDLYPVIDKSADCVEKIENNLYISEHGYSKRLFCQFFPYASYELSACIKDGEVGFSFCLPETEAVISVGDNHIIYHCGNDESKINLPYCSKNDFTMIISCRPGAFDVYFKYNDKPEYVCTFNEDSFALSNKYTNFSNGYAALFTKGETSVKEVASYIDNGISLADMRAVRYENGDVITENGKIYFTASVRIQEGQFSGVFSWIPGTAEFQMTGALFYDCGDGVWRPYIAPVLIYNRQVKQWHIWVVSHEHILSHASFDGEPRFGVNVIDVEIMEKVKEGDDITAFAGFKGDEDPELFYDEAEERWIMAICRLDPESKQYVYVFFESKDPFEGYSYIGRGHAGSETGGSIVKADGERFFVCGNSYSETSEYRIYGKDGMKTACFNYPDGGFRGWGTVIPVKTGSRYRYFWLTFDRFKGSEYNWSYGNIYCFEADSL